MSDTADIMEPILEEKLKKLEEIVLGYGQMIQVKHFDPIRDNTRNLV